MYNPKSHNTGPARKPHWMNDPWPFQDDNGFEAYRDLDGFSIGYSTGPQVLAMTGYANVSFDVGLQAAVPADTASIHITLGEVMNLNAWAKAGAEGTVTSNASSEATLDITGTILNGTLSATLSINASGYIAASRATVHLHITDTFQMSLSGTGYVGATLQTTAQSGSTVVATAPSSPSGSPSGGNAGPSHYGTFDLARFAASVLSTGQASIGFISSAPGESLHGIGTSVMTIAATADILGGPVPQHLVFHDVDRSVLAFNDNSSRGGGLPFGYSGHGMNPISLFHTG